MWTAILGAAMTAGGAIYGGIKSARANQQAKEMNEEQRQKNQNWYDRRYNEDATQRADAQRILTQTRDIIKQRNQAAQGRQAVMGGTEESVAATKEANNKALADATSHIAADAERRKDMIESTYMRNDDVNNQRLVAIEQARAQNTAKAVEGIAKAGASIAGNFSDLGGKDSGTSISGDGNAYDTALHDQHVSDINSDPALAPKL